MDIYELMKLTAEKNASDLHLTPDEPPILRIDGDLKRMEMEKLTSDQIKEMVYKIMNDKHRSQFEKTLEVDFSSEIENVARFRVNVFSHHAGIGAALRMIPYKIPTFDDLHITKEIFEKICNYPNGLIIITGPTGTGKSTTMAAMVDYLNHKPDDHKHILTIEDPIEYLYQNDQCMIHQREVGANTFGFHAALRSALREDPDIILVGEMRDLETIRLALTAAETGHLVLATMHTSSAAKTVDRVVDVFPRNESAVIRSMLAESLRAIIAQVLIPKVGGGRIAAQEIMLASGAIRNLIREQKVPQIYSAIQTGRKLGMRTLEQHIEELVNAKLAMPLKTETKDSAEGQPL